MKLNLGGGNTIMPGYLNVDKLPLNTVNIVHDLDTFPYPFKANQVDEIFMSHCLEHLTDTVKVMGELHRICKPGAKIKIIVPYFANPNQWSDLEHKHTFTWKSHEYFMNIFNFKLIKRKLFFIGSNGFMKSRTRMIDWLINMCPGIYQRFFCYMLPVSEIHFILEVRK